MRILTTPLNYILCHIASAKLPRQVVRPESLTFSRCRTVNVPAAPCSYLPQAPLPAIWSLVFRQLLFSWNIFATCFTYYCLPLHTGFFFLKIQRCASRRRACIILCLHIDQVERLTIAFGIQVRVLRILVMYPLYTNANRTARSSFSSVSPRLDARRALPPLLQIESA